MTEQMIAIRGINIHVEIDGDEHLPAIVFLHGFTGSTATWRDVMRRLHGKYRMIAIDLTGHGQTSVPEEAARYAMEEQTADLEALFKLLALDRFTLVGYSMGGRVALGYTVQYPKRVESLVLESASPGLKTEAERAVRRESDRLLSARITNEGLSKFVDFWEGIPLFHSQKALPEENRKLIRKERLGQRAEGLAGSLNGIGTGSQPSYWESLKTILASVTLITGEIDGKFVTIAREMEHMFLSARHVTVPQAGHAVHVEKPEKFVTIIEEHMKSLDGGEIE
ncbi:2-succinyl-6-hydroxy-2,4-cyclohexadiene-1-carboxylate synthase [Sporosarcina sp. HYO08]|nr:2-succinyl-6-hydroxy-2,4-cyclohexadiene-1-carboxylate synthase [Sporosarcina sp. HYO08]KXH86907.1 2-succinyl-6-hydroxy-2,4-cyclohexadiene-1-carboxylate synthase [Sporosarcina sp. HYO08]